MAQYTIAQVRDYLESVMATPPPGVSTWLDWNEQLKGRSLHIKYDRQLVDLRDNIYPMMARHLLRQYQELIDGIIPESAEAEMIANARRVYQKWRDLQKEIEGRGGYLPARTPVGTTYYIDFVDGSNTSPHDGLKYPTAGGTYTADAGTNTGQVVDTEPPRSTSGDWTGAYLWNETRQAGSRISASTYSGGWTFTLATSITGQTSGDSYYIIDAWLTLAQYTATTTRSAGDIAYIRANKTATIAATIVSDEVASVNNRIHVIGCDSVEADPWHDGSDVKPVLDFNNGNYRWNAQAAWWHLRNMELKNSANTAWPGGMLTTGGLGWLIQKCKIHQFRYNGNGAIVFRETNLEIEDCEFIDNTNTHIQPDVHGRIKASRCVFNGGSTYPTAIAVGTYGGLVGLFIDCNFGQTSAHGTSDLITAYSSQVTFRNCRFNKLADSYTYATDGVWRFEKCSMPSGWGSGDMIIRRSTYLERETSVLRSGGGRESVKVSAATGMNQENLIWGLYNPTPVFAVSLGGAAIPTDRGGIVWMKPGKRIISVYVRAISSWATPPTADELYLEAEWLSGSSGGVRMSARSTQTLSGTDWIEFKVEVNPQQEGAVYFDLMFGKYDASNGIYVDTTPIVT